MSSGLVERASASFAQASNADVRTASRMMDPYHIFISYSSKNRRLVSQLSGILRDYCPGATVFDAEYSVEFGDDLALAVYSELIPRTDTVVLLWTPEAATVGSWSGY